VNDYDITTALLKLSPISSFSVTCGDPHNHKLFALWLSRACLRGHFELNWAAAYLERRTDRQT